MTVAMHSLLHKRDFYAGLLMVLFGLVAAVKGPTYGMGTLVHMGPGFMPTALGVILIILGLVASVMAAIGTMAHIPGAHGEESILPEHPEWLAWGLILAGPLAFIVFGQLGGMIPATFSCVFISALGERTATWKSAFVLASVVTVFGVLLFHNILNISMPVLQWGFS
jgi:hypothetical protein